MFESFAPSERLRRLPPYIFSEINAIKADATRRGIDLVSLGIGDPDLPTPEAIVAKIAEAAQKPENHGYSPYEGTQAFRRAVSTWFERRFDVRLDADREVMALIGSKEGIAHFPVAVCDPGDHCLHPSPGYPVFSTAILLAEGIPVPLPLLPELGFLPDPAEVARLFAEKKPRYCLLNFPSNPCSVTAPRELLAEIVRLAKRHEVLLAYDNAYSEIYFDEKNRPESLLSIPGAKDIAIEFHSFSKTYSMTGWRLGFAVGNEKLVSALLKAKTNIDSGPLLAVQEAGAFALEQGDALVAPIRDVYRKRREYALARLSKMGVEVVPTTATFFLWARVPGGGSSMQFTKDLIESQGLVVTPGIGFGAEGEGFFRLSLTVPEPVLANAFDRLERHFAANTTHTVAASELHPR